MQPPHTPAESDLPPLSPAAKVNRSSPTAATQRRIGIAVDLSDESALAVKWAVQNYLRPGDAVILVHVSPTSVLYGADWGRDDPSSSQQKLEEDFDQFTTSKADDVAQPLVEAKVPFKIHIVKDHDMKERLCLEVERLGLSTVIMGSRGFGESKRESSGRLGSVSDYCVRHCVCPVVVVRYPNEKEGGAHPVVSVASADVEGDEDEEEEEIECHDATDERKDAQLSL